VLGEIDNPRKKFKPTTISTVTVVSVLYVLVNLSYVSNGFNAAETPLTDQMMVVPEKDQFKNEPDTVAALFFARIFGPANSGKIQNSFMAFSSFGNIMVQTFTAARVKQELAKEGILPFTKFFASNKLLVPRLSTSDQNASTAAEDSEATPVGALFLHWVFTLVLIIVTIPGTTSASYRIFVNLYSFVVDALFGCAIGLGIILLRLNKRVNWSRKSSSNSYISLSTALIFTLANCFPLVAVWIKPDDSSPISLPVKWWATGTIGMGLLVLALVYWLVLNYVVPSILGLDLEVEREAQFKKDHGYLVLWHEVTSVNWRTRSS